MNSIKRLTAAAVVILLISGFTVQMSADGRISAESYIIIEASTGITLDGSNQNKKMAPASTTKIMTALIAIENNDPDRLMKVSESAAAVNGSQLGLLAGEELTMKDLLYMLLLKSANDAAVVIAENTAGSTEAFAALMNERAASLGCENTHFTNPHGLPDDNHYTTAGELAVIAVEALKNEVFAAIVSSKSYKTGYHSLVISNSNKLLYSFDYIIGVKTGFTKAAGRCLVSAAEKDGIRLVTVTMNAPDDWSDHIKLYDAAYARVNRKVVYEPYTYRCIRETLNGDSKAVLSNAASVYGLEIDGTPVYYEYREDTEPLLFAPLKAYRKCGRLTQLYNGREVSSTVLCTVNDIGCAQNESLFELFVHKLLNLFKSLL